MSNNKLTTLLLMKDKGVTKTSGSNGILSRLWRQMLLDLDIGPKKFGYMLQAYVIDPRNGFPNNRKDQISTRGNLTKEFARPQMTWKVFCKALRFLNILKIDFAIKAYHANGTQSLHSVTVNFGSRSNTEDFNKLLEQSEEDEFVPEVECLDGVKTSAEEITK